MLQKHSRLSLRTPTGPYVDRLVLMVAAMLEVMLALAVSETTPTRLIHGYGCFLRGMEEQDLHFFTK